MENDIQPSEQPLENAELNSQDHPTGDTQSVRKYKPSLQFALGFFGWFIINSLLWGSVAWMQTTSNRLVELILIPFYYLLCFSIPLNVGVLLVLGVVKRWRPIGLGVLVAISLNIMISLVRGVFTNAMCFAPFYFNAENLSNEWLDALLKSL